MKICFISNLYPPGVLGGAEIVVEKIVRELIKRGHKIIIITTNANKVKEKTKNIQTYRLSLNIYPILDFHKQKIMRRISWHIIDLFNINAYKEIKKS